MCNWSLWAAEETCHSSRCHASLFVCLAAACLQIQPVRSFASHKGGIWDLCSFTVPVAHADTAAGSDDSGSDVVQGCATCGKDGTIRLWDFGAPADALRPLSLVTAGKSTGCKFQTPE
jgi:hypothetical protein